MNLQIHFLKCYVRHLYMFCDPDEEEHYARESCCAIHVAL